MGGSRSGMARIRMAQQEGQTACDALLLTASVGRVGPGRPEHLLHPEQGLGDTVQFIRYAPLVKQRGGIVLVTCPKGLAPLLARCPGIDQLLPAESPLPPFDVHAPLLSLPRILRTTVATIPASGPYLVADEKLIDYWQKQLASYQGIKIGIGWQGSSDLRKRPRPIHPAASLRFPGAAAGGPTFQLTERAGRRATASVQSSDYRPRQQAR